MKGYMCILAAGGIVPAIRSHRAKKLQELSPHAILPAAERGMAVDVSGLQQMLLKGDCYCLRAICGSKFRTY